MRLFIALEIPGEIKDLLEQDAAALKKAGASGNFSRRENYHLTLAFLGETERNRLKQIEDCMDSAAKDSIALTVGTYGCFRRDTGDILWRGIRAGKDLTLLYEELSGELRKKGFSIEKRKFRPHLTVARKYRPAKGEKPGSLPSAEELPCRCDRLTLMRSDRINGVLTYTPVYTVHLGSR